MEEKVAVVKDCSFVDRVKMEDGGRVAFTVGPHAHQLTVKNQTSGWSEMVVQTSNMASAAGAQGGNCSVTYSRVSCVPLASHARHGGELNSVKHMKPACGNDSLRSHAVVHAARG